MSEMRITVDDDTIEMLLKVIVKEAKSFHGLCDYTERQLEAVKKELEEAQKKLKKLEEKEDDF